MNDRDVVIVDALRTAVGRKNGSLSGMHPVVLLAKVLEELVRRTGVPKDDIEDVISGCVDQIGEQAANVGRQAVLLAGLPYTIPATTVDRQCGSGQQAIHFAASLIQADVIDAGIACGVESMSRVPILSPIQTEHGFPVPAELAELYPMVMQGTSADMIAEKWNTSRERIDQFGYESHMKAVRAADEGRFSREIMPVSVKLDGVETAFDRDEGIRPDTSPEKLAALQPAFGENGIHTAGTSSQISDGAAAMLLMTAAKARALGLKPRARVVAQAVVGSDPVLMLTGPITATPKVLNKAGLALEDIDLFEINEAFASVILAWQDELGVDEAKVNVNGGAIALGHPLGCTGVKLMTTLLHELERTGGRYGLEAMCCGGGLGTATIIERLD